MERPRRFRFELLAVLGGLSASFLSPSVALAQATAAAPSSSEDEILVTGVRDQLKTADRFVDGLTIARSSDPLPRYEPGTYCPAVLGLSERLNTLIATRMRTVAASAGVVPARLGCAPSALVIFAQDKTSLLAAFRKMHPIYFTDLQRKEDLPPPEAGPAIAWHLVQLLDPQGSPVRRSPSGVGRVESSFGGSRLRSMVQSVVVMSVVVIERKALLGLTATQVADYAVMRTLTDRAPKTPAAQHPRRTHRTDGHADAGIGDQVGPGLFAGPLFGRCQDPWPEPAGDYSTQRQARRGREKRRGIGARP